MAETLQFSLLLLVVATLAVLTLFSTRSLLRSAARRKWDRAREDCRALLGDLNTLPIDDLVMRASRLRKSISPEVIESLLDDYAAQNHDDLTGRKLADLYDSLGFVEKYIRVLTTAKSWPERMAAAQRLGQIGHARAVGPLIAVFKDATEDPEVKNVAMHALGQIHDERIIEPLIETLGAPDPSSGQPIADVLFQMGEWVVEPLKKQLESSPLEMQRYWAAHILGKLKHHRALTSLLAALSDHSVKVRREAALAIGQLQAPEGILPLTKILLDEPSTDVRQAAAEALGQIADEKVLDSMREALGDLDTETRRRVMEAMERMGERATPFFLDALRSPSPEAAAQAAAALERAGVVAEWVEALSGENWLSAYDGLSAVARAGVVETLSRSLKHPSLAVRIRLCKILAQGAHPRTLEALTERAQNDPEWAGRLEALSALIGIADLRSVPLISDALLKEEPMIREQLLTILQKSPRAFLEPMAPTVGTLTQDTNLSLRQGAIRVLSRIKSPEILSLLLAGLSDAYAPVRKEAAAALHSFSDPAVVQSLINALKDPEIDVRRAAIRSLRLLRDPQAIRPLAAIFEWADDTVQEEAARALAVMPIKEFYEMVDVLMEIKPSAGRTGVAKTLGYLGDEKATRLLTIFMRDPNHAVRAEAARALGRLRSEAAVPHLIEHIKDPSDDVRRAVVTALGFCDNPIALPHLFSLLNHEPVVSVCLQAVIAIACLAGTTTPEADPHTLFRVRQWAERAEENDARAAGVIALALLSDESHFQKIFQAVGDPALRPAIQKFLATLPESIQQRFFDFLSLDRSLFWQAEPSGDVSHYLSLLQSSRHESDRIHAISALLVLKDRASLPAIESTFAKDPSPAVRGNALAALITLVGGESLISVIQRAVKDPSFDVRSRLIPLIKRLSPAELGNARHGLIPLLDSPEAALRSAAAELLSQLYHKDWQILVDDLLGANNKYRILGLIETLGRIGDPSIAPLFLKFIQHGDADVRTASAYAAAESDSMHPPEWMELLNDPQETVRLAAVRGLGRRLTAESIDLLSHHCRDPLPAIRREIAMVLGRQPMPPQESSLTVLRQLSQDEDRSVKLMSYLSMFRLGVPESVREISMVVGRFEPADRKELLAELEHEGLIAKLLDDLKNNRRLAVRKDAVQLLAQIGLPEMTRDILKALSDPSAEVRLAAVEALKKSQDPDIQRQLAALAHDPAESVRRAVQGSDASPDS